MIGRGSAAGNDAVDMGMTFQGLPPGVQDAQEAGLGTQILPLRRDLDQGGGTGMKQECVESLLVLPDQRHQLMGKTEDQMEVSDR